MRLTEIWTTEAQHPGLDHCLARPSGTITHPYLLGSCGVSHVQGRVTGANGGGGGEGDGRAGEEGGNHELHLDDLINLGVQTESEQANALTPAYEEVPSARLSAAAEQNRL